MKEKRRPVILHTTKEISRYLKKNHSISANTQTLQKFAEKYSFPVKKIGRSLVSSDVAIDNWISGMAEGSLYEWGIRRQMGRPRKDGKPNKKPEVFLKKKKPDPQKGLAAARKEILRKIEFLYELKTEKAKAEVNKVIKRLWMKGVSNWDIIIVIKCMIRGMVEECGKWIGQEHYHFVLKDISERDKK